MVTGVLAAIALAVWLLGVVALVVVLPREIHRIPVLSLAADLAPAFVCWFFAVVIAAWPALPIVAALEKLTERRTR